MIHFTANGEFIGIRVTGDPHVIRAKEEYEYIGLKSEILKDEELAKSIVENNCNSYTYKDYMRDLNFWASTASFQSLCAKYNMNEGEWLILKKL